MLLVFLVSIILGVVTTLGVLLVTGRQDFAIMTGVAFSLGPCLILMAVVGEAYDQMVNKRKKDIEHDSSNPRKDYHSPH